MDKAKHTPGPWKAGAQHMDRCTGQYGIWGRGSCVAQTIAQNHSMEEEKANAYLIAAAPELLLQLKSLCIQLEASGMIVPPGVMAAIAKAEA